MWKIYVNNIVYSKYIIIINNIIIIKKNTIILIMTQKCLETILWLSINILPHPKRRHQSTNKSGFPFPKGTDFSFRLNFHVSGNRKSCAGRTKQKDSTDGGRTPQTKKKRSRPDWLWRSTELHEQLQQQLYISSPSLPPKGPRIMSPPVSRPHAFSTFRWTHTGAVTLN